MSDNINLENEDVELGDVELENEEGEIEEPEIIEDGGEEAVTKKEFDALNDKYIRLYAEYENFRKRTAKEKEEIYKNATADVLKDILPVIDNFERALQFSSDEPEKVLEGLKMIEAQFLNSLIKIGVEEIQAAGEQFDPELHYAVSHEQDESQLENTVTEILQKGYKKGDKVLRPAMVKVVN